MLSVCIPVYNFDIRDLICELYRQAEKLSIEYEIVCIDDHSDLSFHNINRSISDKARYIRLDSKIGRARIRNLFLSYAQFNYLLFLDCDTAINHNNYLRMYVDLLYAKPALICGGKYWCKEFDANQRLHYRFDRFCDCLDVSHRLAHPRRNFTSLNFVIKKSILESLPFDDSFADLGHEDTFIGYQLLKRNIPITHIENGVVHLGLESNRQFLKNTEMSVINLSLIYRMMNQDSDFSQMDSIMISYSFCKRFGLLWLVKLLFALSGDMLRKWFIGGFGNMCLFRFYKLGLFVKSMSS